MAAILRDGDFDLNGYVIGGDKSRPVYAVGVDLGVADHRTQDELAPHSQDRYFGQDQLSGPTWTLELRTGRNVTTKAALAALAAVTKAWRSAPDGPGEESTLRYAIDGRTRRVYGRPRSFTADPNLLYSHGYLVTAGQFVTSDTLHYADETNRLTVSLIPTDARGLLSPLISPLTTVAGGKRQGIINVGGDAPAPVVLEFKGPITNPVASSRGWVVGLTGTIAYDQTITVDTRKGTVTRNDGADMGGMLTRRTFLPEARLLPGEQELVFQGIDATGTATCTATWRSTFYSF